MSLELRHMRHVIALDEHGSFARAASALGLSQSALSQHLAILRADGLVTTRREAQSIYYALAPGPAERIIEALHAIYCRPPASRKR